MEDRCNVNGLSKGLAPSYLAPARPAPFRLLFPLRYDSAGMSDLTELRKELSDGFWVSDWYVEPMLNRMRKLRPAKSQDVPVDEAAGTDRNSSEVKAEETVEPKVMEVLLCMAEQPGKTITKQAFKERVWTDTVVTDDVLSRCISQLRKVFGDDSQDPEYVETIRKKGYRLIAPVRLPDAEASVPPTDSSAPDARGGGSAQGESAPSTESGADLPRLMQQVRSSMSMSADSTSDAWVVAAGGTFERRWLIALAGVLFAGALVGVLIWMGEDRGRGALSGSESATPLTAFPGSETHPALSPNGQQVAFAWRAPDSLHTSIYIMQEGAGEPLQVSAGTARDHGPTWSPDGRFLAYVRTSDTLTQVVSAPSIGGSARPRAMFVRRNIHSIAWSPDTTRQSLVLSAEQRPHQAYGLYVRPVEDDTLRRLTAPPLWSVGDHSPAVSPDGSTVAFVRDIVPGVGDLYTLPIEGGEPEPLTRDSMAIDGVAWTPDGGRLLLAARRAGVAGLWRVDRSGGDLELMLRANEGISFRHPSMARSNGRLVYAQQSSQVDIWTFPTDPQATAGEAPIISSTQRDARPSIRPDGERIAFVSHRSGHPEIWTSTTDGSDLSQLTSFEATAIHSVVWSPDGQRLALSAQMAGRTDLYTVSTTGSGATRLTESEGEHLSPHWSRDGASIYFASNRTGAWDIWRQPVDGGPAVQITRGGGVAAQESPDADALYFVRPDTAGIWTAPLDTARFPIAVASTDASAQPDSLIPGAGARPASRQADSVDDAGRTYRRVVDGFLPIHRDEWWVQSNGIYYRTQHDGTATIRHQAFGAETERTLHRFDDPLSGQSFAIAPDGSWLAIAQAQNRESDIMSVEVVE